LDGFGSLLKKPIRRVKDISCLDKHKKRIFGDIEKDLLRSKQAYFFTKVKVL
jgi:hypothetical protein